MAQHRIMLKIMPKICKDRKGRGLPDWKGRSITQSRKDSDVGEIRPDNRKDGRTGVPTVRC